MVNAVETLIGETREAADAGLDAVWLCTARR
jgi:hypothetical protein